MSAGLLAPRPPLTQEQAFSLLKERLRKEFCEDLPSSLVGLDPQAIKDLEAKILGCFQGQDKFANYYVGQITEGPDVATYTPSDDFLRNPSRAVWSVNKIGQHSWAFCRITEKLAATELVTQDDLEDYVSIYKDYFFLAIASVVEDNGKKMFVISFPRYRRDWDEYSFEPEIRDIVNLVQERTGSAIVPVDLKDFFEKLNDPSLRKYSFNLEKLKNSLGSSLPLGMGFSSRSRNAALNDFYSVLDRILSPAVFAVYLEALEQEAFDAAMKEQVTKVLQSVVIPSEVIFAALHGAFESGKGVLSHTFDNGVWRYTLSYNPENLGFIRISHEGEKAFSLIRRFLLPSYG